MVGKQISTSYVAQGFLVVESKESSSRKDPKWILIVTTAAK